jgi:hypothetical protein
MADLSGFDASQVPEQQEFSALPEGQYIAIATASEKKPTKRGDGAYLQITFEVIDGPQKNRKVWSRLNLWNQNQTTIEIAQRELGAVCRAVGIILPNDSAELHNKPLLLTVAVELDKQQRQCNVIKKYEPVSAGGAVGFSPAPAPAVAQQNQAAAVLPPWQK